MIQSFETEILKAYLGAEQVVMVSATSVAIVAKLLQE